MTARTAALAVGIALAGLSTGGCRGERHEPAGDQQGLDPVSVALVLPGPADDRSWNQSAYEALRALEQPLGLRIAWTASVPQTEDAHLRVLRKYASEGFDLVIAHGGEFVPAATKVADEFPTVRFALIDAYVGNNRNLGALSFREAELGYLNGVVAGLATKTRTVAYLGGLAYTSTRDHSRGFERGVHSVDPGITVRIAWAGSWTDSAPALEAARARMEQGADVLDVDLNAPAADVIAEARKRGVRVIGENRDMEALAPGAVLTSGVRRVDVLLREAVRLVRADRWEGKQYQFGLREGALEQAPFRDQLTPAQVARVEAVRADLVAGRIEPIPPQAAPELDPRDPPR